ncbi:MAG: ABC transporter permease [Thermomicrobiales bacterium]
MASNTTLVPSPRGLASRPAATGRARWAIAQMLGNETAKHLLTLWHRRVIFLGELAAIAAFYLGAQYLIGGGQLIDELLSVTMLGFLPYIVAYIVLVKVVSGILEEMNTGTLEQIHLSPLPPWMLSSGLLGAMMIQGVLMAALVGGAIAIGFDVEFPALKWAVLVPAALTLLDIAGFALFVGGIALTVTSIGAINHVIYSLIGMLSGAYVPVYVYPDWLQVIAKLVPTTLGIDVMRKLVIDDRSLAATWSDHSLQWTLLHAAAMLLLGWTVYQWQIRRGLREGRLGPR